MFFLKRAVLVQTTLNEIKVIIVDHDCHVHKCQSLQIIRIFTNFIFVYVYIPSRPQRSHEEFLMCSWTSTER